MRGAWLSLAIEVQQHRVGPAAPLLLGGLVIGALALAVRTLGENSQDELFSGQVSLPTLAAATAVAPLAILLVAKALGYAVSAGCGFRGGPVFPPIFLGIALATIPTVLLGQSPTVAVAVGVAAGMAAPTRLLFSPVLFAILLVGSGGHDAVVPAVIASAAAWLTAAALQRRADPAHT